MKFLNALCFAGLFGLIWYYSGPIVALLIFIAACLFHISTILQHWQKQYEKHGWDTAKENKNSI